MKNKMISALLATAMVASMMTVPALASEGETEAAATVDLSNVEADGIIFVQQGLAVCCGQLCSYL